MTDNLTPYDDIDQKVRPRSDSIYSNPGFLNEQRDNPELTLLNDTSSSSSAAIEESPFVEVAVNVSNTDDPTMPCVTVRSVFLGILLTCLMSFTIQFFAYRTSPIDVNIGIVILVSYLIGELLTRILPKSIFNITINPGPFTVKEHALITIMATSSVRTYEAMEALTVQRIYYNYYLSHFNSILFLLIMQFLSISISGILNRYLIWPAYMIWPKTLMSCSLIRALTHTDESNIGKSRWTSMSRATFFWLIFLFSFIYYWLPGYIFPILSFFSLICMIGPKNLIFSQITGANGLALGAFELDWNAWVAYLDSPILTPFWAHIHILIGFILVAWIGTPLVYYLNIWDTEVAPIFSNRAFDKDGYYFDATQILDDRLRLNKTAHHIYGDAYLTAGNAVAICFTFAGIAALIVHTVLYYGKTIKEQFRSTVSDKPNDIHAKLMLQYPTVPDWWYYIILILTVLVAAIFCSHNGLMPIPVMLLTIVFLIVLVLPNGIITATTNMMLTGCALNDFITGIILPGHPLGFLTFRVFSCACQNQIIVHLTSFKIGHYMKISPRVVFCSLILSSVISCIIHYITAIYLLNHVPKICSKSNLAWKCLNVENTHTASVVFGVVGAFRPGSKYFPILWAVPVGFVLPIISWCLWKKYPEIKWISYINFPILLLATANLPPAPTVTFPSWVIVGFIFNYIIYRHANDWWEKYAYIFSAAMSCGVAVCGFVIFFVLNSPHTNTPSSLWRSGGSTGDGCPLASANYSGILPAWRQYL
ncbi:unnamed protein product [Adineta steineri]|uniref:Uncharacterized protein n=1 Tax=Adineta steineri TaxID=433720 RepID=A0A815C5V9_9BILA|nr:unnamed protein product [Adineta steineri]CAF1344538.1 unnamed protein product [Adineta steineri]CAF3560095.1 unnamed protein product [Adineta steineri]CAF3843229.1 unnamed protein product [Adineta steineri]